MGKKRPAEVRIRAFANDIEKLLPEIREARHATIHKALLESDATAEEQVAQIQELKRSYDTAYQGLLNVKDFVNGE